MKIASLALLACLFVSAFTQAPEVSLISSTPIYPSSYYLTNIGQVNNNRLVSFTGGETAKIYEACTYNFQTNQVAEWANDVCLLEPTGFLLTNQGTFYCVGVDPKDKTALVVNKINPFPTPRVLSSASLNLYWQEFNLGVSDTTFTRTQDDVLVISTLGTDAEPEILVFDGIGNNVTCQYSPSSPIGSNITDFSATTTSIVYVNTDSIQNNTYTVIDCAVNEPIISAPVNLGSYSQVNSGFFALNQGSVYVHYNNFINSSSSLVLLNAQNATVEQVLQINNVAFTESNIPAIVTYGDWIWKVNDTHFNVLLNKNGWVYIATYSVNGAYQFVKAGEVNTGFYNITFSLFVPGANLISLYFATNYYSEYVELNLTTYAVQRVYTGNSPAILANGTWVLLGQYGYYVANPDQTYTFTFLPINDYYFSASNYSLVWGLFIPNVTNAPGNQCYLLNIDCLANTISTIPLSNCPYAENLVNDFDLQDVSNINGTLYVMYQTPYGQIFVLEGNETSYSVQARENDFPAYPNYANKTIKVIPRDDDIYTYDYVTGELVDTQKFPKHVYGHCTVNEEVIFVQIHLDLLTTEYELLNLTTFEPIVDVKRSEISIFTPLKKDFDAAVLGVNYNPDFKVIGWVNAVLNKGIERARVYDFYQAASTDVPVAGAIIPVNNECFAIQTTPLALIQQFNVYKVKFVGKTSETIEY